MSKKRISEILDYGFPAPRGDKPGFLWACKVMRLWREAGYPDLIGVPAEQVHVAREILYGKQ